MVDAADRLQQARVRRARLSAALDAFRSLSPDDQVELAISIEAELGAALAAPAQLALPPGPEERAARAVRQVPRKMPAGPRGGRPRSYTDLQAAKAIALARQGKSDREIADSVGVSESVAANIRRGASIKAVSRASRGAPAARARKKAEVVDEDGGAPAKIIAIDAAANDEAPATSNVIKLDVDVEDDEDNDEAPVALSVIAIEVDDEDDDDAPVARRKRARLLTPDEEKGLARSICDLEVSAWRELLADPQIADRAWSLAWSKLDDPPPAGASASKMRAADLDRHVLDALLRDLASEYAARWWKAAGTPDGHRRFTAALAAADQASTLRDRYVTANQGLAATLARRLILAGMPFEDLMQEAMMGLMLAVPRFDPNRGFRFSTFATWWIRHKLQRVLLNQHKIIRVPVHLEEALARIRGVRRRLRAELQREATDAEVAADLKLEVKEILRLESLGNAATVSRSLDEPQRGVDGDEGRELGETLTDPSSEISSPFDAIVLQADQKRLTSLLEKLSPQERDILRGRFGFGGRDEQTLREIGDKYALSRERIRQIERQAIQKLRRLAGNRSRWG